MENRIALRLPPHLAQLVRMIAETEKRSINRQLELFVEAAVQRWLQEHPQPEGQSGA